jgi:hypothetical protein
MDKRWILIVNVERTIEEERKCFILQQIEYDHPQMFLAPDKEGALDYCVCVLDIGEERIS